MPTARIIAASELFLRAASPCKIAGSDLILRHSALRTKFRDEHPTGQDAEVVAMPEYMEWVEQQWKRITGPAAD